MAPQEPSLDSDSLNISSLQEEHPARKLESLTENISSLKNKILPYDNELRNQLMEDPNVERTIEEMVQSLGLDFECHHAATQDGYVLEMHRLYKPPGEDYEEGDLLDRPVVFVQHGLLSSSETFVLGMESSLVY